MHFDFLLCSERSGSNLITQLLNAHPEVCAPFPSHLLLRVGRHAWRYGDLARDGAWELLLGDVADYLDAMHSTWSKTPTAAELAAAASGRTFADVFRAAYEILAAHEGKGRVFVKDNHAAEDFGQIEAAFEAHRYLFVVRDPRDMAMTWRDNAMEPGGVAAAAACWLGDQTASLRVLSALGPRGRAMLLRFEDLVTEPEASMRRVCGFLGLDYTPAMLDFHRDPLLQHNAASLSSWTDLARPIDPSVVGRFRTRLSGSEVRYIEAVCGEQMAVFGYPRDHEAPGDARALRSSLPDGADGVPEAAEVAIFDRWYAVRDRIATRTPPRLAAD